MTTAVTLRSLTLNRQGHTSIRTNEGNTLVQWFKRYIERFADWTARLLELSNSLHVEFFGRVLLYQILSLFQILLPDPQFDATNQIGPEPVEANDIFVAE